VRHDPGMADELEQQYPALVERVRRYPMPEAARAAVLAELEAAYRRERAAMQRSSTSSLQAPKRAPDLNQRSGAE